MMKKIGSDDYSGGLKRYLGLLVCCGVLLVSGMTLARKYGGIFGFGEELLF